MASSNHHLHSEGNQLVFNTAGSIIVSLMMTCLAITAVLFARRLIPDWNAIYLPLLCFLMTLERIYTYKRVKRLLIMSRSWWVYHVSQWLFILVFLKIILLITQRPESLWVEFQLWRLDFITYFFDNSYIFAIIFLVMIWTLSGYFAKLLDEMSLEESLIRYDTSIMAPISGPPARERLLAIVFVLGFILVILTAMMRVNLRMLTSGQFDSLSVEPLPYLAAGAWNVLLYFILGLVLMSLSQFARLNARWHFQKIQITPKLAIRWAAYSLIFIFLLAIIASLLPTNYSLGFLSILAYILKYVIGFLFFIIGVFWSLVIYIFNFILSLLGITPQSEVSLPSSNFSPPPPPVEPASTNISPWVEILKSLLFWSVFIGIIGFSIYQFLRQHEGILLAIRQTPGISWLSKILSWFFRGIKGLNQKISRGWETGLSRLRARRGKELSYPLPRYINLRRLTPRQRIYFFFLAMIRRGGERGIRRKISQTPYEYAKSLETKVPEVNRDIHSLTDAFVDARYSRRDVDDEEAGVVKRYWEKIRGALRSFRK